MLQVKYGDKLICYPDSNLQFEANFEGIDEYGVLIVAEQFSVPQYRAVGGKFVKLKYESS